MKLKYYLRGIGVGVIVATLIMSVSSVIHNNNLSDERIIEEAQKLGMIMPENTEDKDGLWQKNTEDDIETENSALFESSQIEDLSEMDSSTETQMTEKKETVIIFVESGEVAHQVSQKLEEAGVIEDAEAFREYLQEKGYTTKIRSGYHEIPMDATYGEIAENLRRK